MGVVISSVVAAGPAVLEDLETPYDVIVERRNKANEKKNQKHKLRRQPHQIHFEALQPKNNEDKKSKVPGQVRTSSRTSVPSSSTSRPQSRSSKPQVLKRQESMDLSLSPNKVESLQTQEEPQQGSLSVTDRIRQMLTTPREKKKTEMKDEKIVEEEKVLAATSTTVEEIVGTMFKTAENMIIAEDHPDKENIENKDDLDKISQNTESIAKPLSTKSGSEKNSVKLTQKEKVEMIKQLPSARQEEFKAYSGISAGQQPNGLKQKPRKSSTKKLAHQSQQPRKKEKPSVAK